MLGTGRHFQRHARPTGARVHAARPDARAAAALHRRCIPRTQDSAHGHQANTSLALEEERSSAEYRQALEAADRATDTTTRIVQDLLLLARGDAGQLRLERRPVLMGELLERAVEALRGSPAPIAIELSTPSLLVPGDAHHLLRLFTNRLENAVRHTPPTGSITVLPPIRKARARGKV